MMEMELVSETFEFINHLTLLSARENVIEFCRRENFNSYKTVVVCRVPGQKHPELESRWVFEVIAFSESIHNKTGNVRRAKHFWSLRLTTVATETQQRIHELNMSMSAI
jgi:hypothetical protein